MTEPTPRKIARYGWVPDLPDARDHLFAAPPQTLLGLPTSVDLRDRLPAGLRPGAARQLHGERDRRGAFEFCLLKQKAADFMPSRLFIYYNERAIEGTVASDSGAQIRDGIKSVAKQGVCPETEWPYDIRSSPTSRRRGATPTPSSTRSIQLPARPADAQPDQGLPGPRVPVRVRLHRLRELREPGGRQDRRRRRCRASGEQVLGGHAVLAVGYDDAQQRMLVRNSWGDGWGMGGYFTMPYAYFTERSLSSDFWAVLSVSG